MIQVPGLAVLAAAATMRDDIIPIARGAQIETHLRFANAHEVAVAFNEAGDGELAAEIDDSRRGAFEPRAVCACSDGDDAAVANGDGMNFWLSRIESDDFAVTQNEVGGSLGENRRGDEEEKRELSHAKGYPTKAS